MAEFRVFKGREQLAQYSFRAGSVRIGRNPNCDIHLSDPSVSRNHAEINLQGEAWVLKSSQARNGMFVNGNMVNFRVLKPGDLIEISHFVIQFEEGHESIDNQGPSMPMADPERVLKEGEDSTTVSISLHDALQIHQLNTQVMGAHLAWYDEGNDENIVPIEEERTLIGSTPDCQAQLQPRHGAVGLCAAIVKDDDSYMLEPLKDSGDLKINAVGVARPTRLADGDRILWGNYILQFRLPFD